MQSAPARPRFASSPLRLAFFPLLWVLVFVAMHNGLNSYYEAMSQVSSIGPSGGLLFRSYSGQVFEAKDVSPLDYFSRERELVYVPLLIKDHAGEPELSNAMPLSGSWTWRLINWGLFRQRAVSFPSAVDLTNPTPLMVLVGLLVVLTVFARTAGRLPRGIGIVVTAVIILAATPQLATAGAGVVYRTAIWDVRQDGRVTADDALYARYLAATSEARVGTAGYTGGVLLLMVGILLFGRGMVARRNRAVTSSQVPPG